MRFLASVLRALDRTYRFDGAVPPSNELELSSAVQLVHDVSREAHYIAFTNANNNSAGLTQESWRRFGFSFAHIGAGTMVSTQDPYAILNIDPNRFMMWWYHAAASTTVASVVTSGTLAALDPAAMGLNDETALLDYVAGATGLTTAGTDAIMVPRYEFQGWRPIFHGTTLRARSTVTGAATVRIISDYLQLPRGVPPMFAH